MYKVYELLIKDTSFYVGMTSRSLCKRLNEHRYKISNGIKWGVYNLPREYLKTHINDLCIKLIREFDEEKDALKYEEEYTHKLGWNYQNENTSKAKMGHVVTPEVRAKMSKTRIEKGLSRGRNNPFYGKMLPKKAREKAIKANSVPVVAIYSDGRTEEYPSMAIAERKLGVYRTNIGRCCRGLVHHAGRDSFGNKIAWKYV